MIPSAFVDAWRDKAPWREDSQVEQDLVLSRALCEIFSQPGLGDMLAFRGGTALNKMYLRPASRYSEDIDFVQIAPGPIGPVLDGLRTALDPWLGIPRCDRKLGGVKLRYAYATSSMPTTLMRVKIEINTREHFTLLGLVKLPLEVNSAWYSACAHISTFALDELLATKLRALYQRNKGRDLYDLWKSITHLDVEPSVVAALFCEYLGRSNSTISRAEFEENMAYKLQTDTFRRDVLPLLPGVDGYDVDSAAELVMRELIARLPGDPWQGRL